MSVDMINFNLTPQSLNSVLTQMLLTLVGLYIIVACSEDVFKDKWLECLSCQLAHAEQHLTSANFKQHDL